MSTITIIARNASFLFVSQIISTILGFFYIMASARYLGVEGFGILSFALALSGIFSVFIDLGLNTLTVREIAREKSSSNKYLTNISLIKVILSVLSFIIFLTILLISGYSDQIVVVVSLVCIGTIFNAITSLFYGIYQAHEVMQYQSFGQILSSGLLLAGALCAIYFNLSIIGFSFIYVVSGSMVLIYNTINSSRLFSFHLIQPDFLFIKESLHKAWPIGAMAICNIFRFKSDTIILSVFWSEIAIGLYSAAYQILNLSVLIPSMIITSSLPFLFQQHQKEIHTFTSICGRLFKYLLSLALPVVFGAILLSDLIISLIYGVKYFEASSALKILMIASASMYVSMLIGSVYIAANLQHVSMKLTFINVVVNILLNLILIPKFSYIGASITTVITELFGLGLGILFLRRYGYSINITDASIRPIFCIICAIIIAFIWSLFFANILVIAFIALGSYILIIYKIGLDDYDRSLIKGLITLPLKIFLKEV